MFDQSFNNYGAGFLSIFHQTERINQMHICWGSKRRKKTMGFESVKEKDEVMKGNGANKLASAVLKNESMGQ